MQAQAALTGESASFESDLGPLAWVLDELRKSLDGATKALRRFVRDAELSRGSDLAALDGSHLRIARQQLHQAVGALEMVGLEVPAKMLRAMETLVQKFVQKPEFCSDEAALKVERASFALTDYLEGILKGKRLSAVALFPQYREVLDLVGEDRIHPADLWQHEWRWIDVPLPPSITPLPYDATVRSRIDGYILNVVKTGHVPSARAMLDISLGFAAGQTELHPRVLWAVAAAYFQSVALGLSAPDIYAKRAASRVLLQYRTLARGEPDISERLVQDLLFFCAQAVVGPDQEVSALRAVQIAYGLAQPARIDYDKTQFGRFDPALLAQARKRIAAATETWSSLSGGETSRIKTALDQFSLVSDSIVKLHPESGELASALTRALDAVSRSGNAPIPSLAMEVATAVLYLEAAYEDLDPTNELMLQRGNRLAQRLDHALSGGKPEPLDEWMEELYRRVSDRQTMGSVVDELRGTLNEVESSLDTYFRHPEDKTPLQQVPGCLSQMRGVFSVLGLDQAAVAVLRMRDSAERFLVDDAATDSTGVFEKLGNSLGALGFLIDMLSYQRELAKKLFVYDDALGEFRSLMGRQKPKADQPAAAPQLATPVVDATPEVLPTPPEPPAPALPTAAVEPAAPRLPETAALAQPAPAVPQPATLSPSATPEIEDDDAELRDIFLDEAREVAQNGLGTLAVLRDSPADLEQQTSLRRCFHTLKGSSRMVGLNEFGEAAWAMEQLLNAWLPQQLAATPALIRLSEQAIEGFARWIEDIAAHTDASWRALPFRQAADRLRLDGVAEELLLPKMASVATVAEPVELMPPPDPTLAAPPAAALDLPANELYDAPELPEDFSATQMIDFGDTQTIDFTQQPQAHQPGTDAVGFLHAGDTATEDLLDLSFDQLLPAPPDAPPVVADAIEVSFDLEDVLTPLAPAVLPEAPATEPALASEPDPLQDLAAELSTEALPEPASTPAPEAQPVPESADETESMPETEPEDQVKVIDSLRIGLALYNVYLNEADEWSRRLLTELTEWSFELDHPLQDNTVALAHSLAGSSATVGFMALSELARALEYALEHTQLGGAGLAEHAKLFIEVAEDIRRLLHQFAAGFLKQPDPAHLEALRAILDVAFGNSVQPAPNSQEPEDLLLDDLNLDFAPVATGVASLVEPELVPEEEIGARDTIDVDLFPIFEEEALELLPQLGSALRQWSAHPDAQGARREVLRALHTLKGSARLAGAMRLGEMAHRMESAAETIDMEAPTSALIDPLLARLDSISACFDELRAMPLAALVLPEAAPVPQEPEPAPDIRPDVLPVPDKVEIVPVPVSVAPSQAAPAPLARRSSNQTTRVKSKLLERMLNQAGEVMITRSRLEARLGQLRGALSELTGNLNRLRHQLRDMELQSESQMESRLAQTKDTTQGFDPLEFDRFTRVQELTRMMAESVHDVATLQRSLQQTVEGVEDDLVAQARQTRELQRDLLRTRMVDFESVSDRLYGVVRQAAKDYDKPVKLEIVGGSLDMDRGVLDRVAPAFEHLLRNAVGHGIEPASERAKAGKPALGSIIITVTQQGNDVIVAIRDDGAGLNLSRIRQKALEKGQIRAEQTLSDDEIANLIFTSGLSTADEVSEMAGRGVGMDVVRTEVSALGGRIELSTTSGHGTQFKLVLPLTMAVTQVVLLRMGEVVMGVPSNLVEVVRRIPVAELDAAYQSHEFDCNGEAVAFFWAGALLQISASSTDVRGKTAVVAVFRSAGQRVAMHVDEVLGNQEAVVKNLGPQLSRLPGLAGMSVLASGAVVLIYNPVALAHTYGQRARTFAQPVVEAQDGTKGLDRVPGVPTAPRQMPLVLVVDDSITVRRVTQRLLKREGYRVALANDGLHALEVLQIEKPSVVLTDIEMPRMDGFDLVRNIRADENLQGMPIIMITSRLAEKHRDYARTLKVDHYLGKPYPEDELISLVRAYCSAEAEAKILAESASGA